MEFKNTNEILPLETLQQIISYYKNSIPNFPDLSDKMISYDYESDINVISFNWDKNYQTSEDHGNYIIDLDKDGQIIGVEILNFNIENYNMENYIEQLAEEVHNAWMKEKLEQGFHAPRKCDVNEQIKNAGYPPKKDIFDPSCNKCHPDLYPYSELPENIKEYDRVTVRVVLDAIKKLKH